MAGIVGYGAHLPRHRIKVEEIAKVWGADAPSYKRGLMLREKSVPPPDMDTITLSVEATDTFFVPLPFATLTVVPPEFPRESKVIHFTRKPGRPKILGSVVLRPPNTRSSVSPIFLIIYPQDRCQANRGWNF